MRLHLFLWMCILFCVCGSVFAQEEGVSGVEAIDRILDVPDLDYEDLDFYGDESFYADENFDINSVPVDIITSENFRWDFVSSDSVYGGMILMMRVILWVEV